MWVYAKSEYGFFRDYGSRIEEIIWPIRDVSFAKPKAYKSLYDNVGFRV